MKVYIRIIAILILLGGCSDSVKLGYVETDQLLIEFHETKLEAKKLEKNTLEIRSRFDTLKIEFDQMQEEFTQKLSLFSETERQEAEVKLKSKQSELNRYYNYMSEEIKKKDDKVTKKLLLKIDEVVKVYGEENNYEFILGATHSGNIVYAKDASNLTDEIIAILNK